jgi:hypothetical protein
MGVQRARLTYLILHNAACFVGKNTDVLVSLLPRGALGAELHQDGFLQEKGQPDARGIWKSGNRDVPSA